jgi:polyphosphate kinase 2 (PPK2 family)
MGDVMALKAAAGNKPKMKRKAYEKELGKLQVELCHLQDWVKKTGARIRRCGAHGIDPGERGC